MIKPSVEEKDIIGKKLEKSKKLEDKVDKKEIKQQINNENLIGIINIGNSCYINSIIQVLIHTPIFINEFLNNKEEIKKMPITTSYNFLQIYDNIIKAKDYKNKEVDISSFIYFFSLKHPQFKPNEQQDAIEFFRVISEDINTELNKANKKYIYKEIEFSDDNNKIIMSKEFERQINEKENSIISQNFYSQLLNTYICECQAIKYSFQRIGDIPLLLPDKRKDVSLNELLDIYFSGETVDFEYKCKNCHKIVKHLKYVRFAILPKILIISLQRIDTMKNKKNNIKVIFEDFLDLDKFIDNDFLKGNSSKYKLYGVVCHMGTVNFGHYTAYLNLGLKGRWFEFNDSSVTITGNEFPKDNAYILFYINDEIY